jgi:hypothetical protein
MSFYKILEKEFQKDRIGVFKEIMPHVIETHEEKHWISLIIFGQELKVLKDPVLDKLYFDRLEKFVYKKRQLLTEKSSSIDGTKQSFVCYVREAWNSYALEK